MTSEDTMAEEGEEGEEDNEIKNLVSSYIGISFSLFLAFLPKNLLAIFHRHGSQLKELSAKLFQAEEQLKQMKSRRQEDSKANARVVEIFAGHRNSWRAEEKRLLHQVDACTKEIAHLRARVAEFEVEWKARIEDLQRDVREKEEMLNCMSRREQEDDEESADVQHESLESTYDMKHFVARRESPWKADGDSAGVSSKLKLLEEELLNLEKTGKSDTSKVSSLMRKQAKIYQTLAEKIDDLCGRIQASNPSEPALSPEFRTQRQFLLEAFQLQQQASKTRQKLMELQTETGKSYDTLTIRRAMDSSRNNMKEIQRNLETWLARIIGDLEGVLARDSASSSDKNGETSSLTGGDRSNSDSLIETIENEIPLSPKIPKFALLCLHKFRFGNQIKVCNIVTDSDPFAENEPPVIADNIKNVNYPSSALKEPINEPVNEVVISTNNFADENCEAHTSMEPTRVIELGCKSSIGGPPQEIYYKNIEFQFDTDDNDDDNEVQNVPPDAFEATHVLHDQFPSNHVETTELPDNIDEFEGYVDEGDPIYECSYCEALLWFNEQSIKDRKRSTARSHSLCCLKGKVVLPTMKRPPPLFESLFFDKESAHSRNFYENIRQYNNVFSFTSMGGKIDHSKNTGGGPYSFVMSGMNYHNIGSLLPPEGSRPVYSQLYIFDTENEVSNRISAVSTRQNDGRTYNMPNASEVAALVVGDIDMTFNVRDIIVEKHSGIPQRINELHASYLPLQYPILFPFGEDGYRDDIKHREITLSATKTKKSLSMREFFSYRLITRLHEISTLLHASRLLQQFIVDGYTMIKSKRLLWVRTHQKELRVDLYQGLADAVLSGETNGATIGKMIILPSSFTGGARYMLQNYQDAMAICRSEGYPDLFLTFTCTPAWPEIQRFCRKHSIKPCDRPDIFARIFKIKLDCLMKTIKEEKYFGTIRADIYTIEFQKRGLPHAHILLFLYPNDKIKDPEAINNFICAEIPDKNISPLMYKLVRQFMFHGPCGRSNIKAPCMKNQKCSKYFPKKFNENTIIDEDGYPTYRRRDDGKTIKVKGIPLDNRYVVPYNPLLLQKFHAHINIEKCNHSTAIKYLFKYISKGSDTVVAAIFDGATNEHGEANVDEIKQYYNCRYISACEGSWRIFGFNIHHRKPSVERLSFHLPNQQHVIYSNHDDVVELLDKPRVNESQFLAWMEKNKTDAFARTLTYIEFPKHYVYQRNNRAWKRRKKGSSISRITRVTIIRGIVLPTFVAHKSKRGLLDDDQEYISAIKEAFVWASGHSLRKLFVSMLLCFSLHRLDFVWMETSKLLSEDALYIHRNDPMLSSVNISEYDKEQVALQEIDSLLRKNGKSLLDFPTMPLPEELPPIDVSNQLILQELNYDKHALQVEENNLQTH
ncbi:hypothetical protein K1719_034216 [Acacia pycnantha]|nr:hypothetical protein K1719_034216 [Acacia pycnantha]